MNVLSRVNMQVILVHIITEYPLPRASFVGCTNHFGGMGLSRYIGSLKLGGPVVLQLQVSREGGGNDCVRDVLLVQSYSLVRIKLKYNADSTRLRRIFYFVALRALIFSCLQRSAAVDCGHLY